MIIGFFVRLKGLEPPRLSAPDPKSGAATNYATSAGVFFSITGAKIQSFFVLFKQYGDYFTNIIRLTMVFSPSRRTTYAPGINPKLPTENS